MSLDNIPLIWFAIPLIIMFSLVYQGTRNEDIATIISRSLRTMLSVSIFMILLLVVLGMMMGRSI